ncbi:MAG TPA: DUF5694 domain-containing protein [Candidatus Aminicenantes bacterium]|nr:DUF5694 domain-containing protein [Candidatus Aminicenantes bacterium]HRY64012.1 DUF5694 domain-containing protein [Candidatus Aminicenantes bacterium]HRZ70925.1 DUF5694 domain-containing protein [Candidatus Aminicenantes bacterium]
MKKSAIAAMSRSGALAGALILVTALAAVPAAVPVRTPSAPQSKPEILILGTYHMANPGRDVFNTKADDVLLPKRQAEIAELLKVLGRFRPTKIAVESNVFEDKVKTRYADYLAGNDALTRNEIDQIGFRLAKELGMKTVCAVDCDGDFPWPRIVNYAKGKGKAREFDQLYAEVGEMVRKENDFLASHSVLETLLYLNADDRTAWDMGFYFRIAHFGEPGDYAGPDWLAAWYQRNLRIYNNITSLIESPKERILVIYGYGHLGWLRQMAENDPSVRLRRLAEIAAARAR